MVTMKAIVAGIACNMVVYENPVSWTKDLDAVTNRNYFSRWFVTQPARFHAVFAIDFLKVGAAQPACTHLDQHITACN